MQKTVVFILSENRSGSTWLSYVLGSHKNAAFLGEYHRPFTLQGHVPCLLCEARGLSNCEFFYGIENVSKKNAFNFAFESIRKPILIDCSKSIKWTKLFLHSQGLNIKCIHLIRDPRGWFASQKKREKLSVRRGMKRWFKNNMKIKKFLNDKHLDNITIFYDSLASNPDCFFPPLCEFLGMGYERAALEYWNFEHHGLGGNGAAFNILGQYKKTRMITADDRFYKKNEKRQFYDQRWRNELSTKEIEEIENNKNIKFFFASSNVQYK